jgi:hypothetical protein
VRAPAETLEAFWLIADDVRDAGKVADVATETADQLSVSVTLAPSTNSTNSTQ